MNEPTKSEKTKQKSTPVKMTIKQTREFLKSLRQLHNDGELDFENHPLKLKFLQQFNLKSVALSILLKTHISKNKKKLK